MRIVDLRDKNVVIWGTGREGQAAAAFIHAKFPNLPLTFVDENAETSLSSLREERAGVRWENTKIIQQPDQIAATLDAADIIIKSPGVSLYHPLIQKALDKKTPLTSLLNLWVEEPRKATVITVTGTKGKSTTSALLAHALNALGKKTVLVGNIGRPVTETPDDADVIVIEVSSYQAATFSGKCAMGVLTSLFPEHLDWHKSLDNYYQEKINLLRHCDLKIVNAESVETLRENGLKLDHTIVFNQPHSIHLKENHAYDNEQPIGLLNNNYLLRPSNVSNVCAVLTVIKKLGFDPKHALVAMKDFQGLPHRQQELGVRDNILYVDDSISTTPQSAIAAMQGYAGKPITLIAGGHDRGIDYTPLVDFILANKINAVMCLGPSGKRIYDALWKAGFSSAFCANTMQEAVSMAKTHTSYCGVILLSPAAPSYGLFKNFEERGDSFAKESGFFSSPFAGEDRKP